MQILARIGTITAPLALVFLAGCDTAPKAPEVAVKEAWVRLPAVAGRPGAAYFTLEGNVTPMKLVSVTSPDVERIELHDSMSEGGMMKMAPLTDTSFPDGGTMEFAPGGKHAMLFGIDPKIQPGGKVRLTFTFDPAPAVTVEAEARAAGDPGHSGH